MASGCGCIIVSNAKIGRRPLLGFQSIRVPSNRGGESTLPNGLYCRRSKIQNHCRLVLAQAHHHSQPLQFESNFCTLPSSQMTGTLEASRLPYKQLRTLEASSLPYEQAEAILQVMVVYFSALAKMGVIREMRRQLEKLGLQFKQAEAIITVVMNVAHSMESMEGMQTMMRQLETSGLPSKQAEAIVKVLFEYFSASKVKKIGKMRRQLEASGVEYTQADAILSVVMYVAHSEESKKMEKESEWDAMNNMTYVLMLLAAALVGLIHRRQHILLVAKALLLRGRTSF